MDKEMMKEYRFFLKDTIRKMVDFSETDQNKRMPPPPIEKPCPAGVERIALPKRSEYEASVRGTDIVDAIAKRKSRRRYKEEGLSLEELSFLLWATQGIREKPTPTHALRTVPSAGCRHAFETYLAVFNVHGLAQGIYRYLPTSHMLVKEAAPEELAMKVMGAALGQPFAGYSAVTFIWTAIPYRMEWRYSLAAHKVIAIDVGHVCQNLYLACEAIDAGTCAIAAYDQEIADALIGVDGEEEFVLYMAPVGKVK